MPKTHEKSKRTMNPKLTYVVRLKLCVAAKAETQKNLETLEASFSLTFHLFWAYDTTFVLSAHPFIHF